MHNYRSRASGLYMAHGVMDLVECEAHRRQHRLQLTARGAIQHLFQYIWYDVLQVK
jgi:hypothetical protein